MWNIWCKQLICFYAVLVTGQTQDEYLPDTTTMSILSNGEKKMSEYILDVLKHFQNPDPLGLPGADVPDPMFVPDTRNTFGLTTLLFKDTAVHGISKFRILHLNADIASMKITANMSIDKLEAKGNCVTSYFWNTVESPFSIKFRGINITGVASLGVSRDGKLTAQDVGIEISVQTVSLTFENSGALNFIISGVVNTAGNLIFKSIKPYILEEARTNAKKDISTKLHDIVGDLQFPNTISPLDMVIIDVRKKIRAMNMDPYKVEDYNSTMGLFSVNIYNTYISGISSFKRVGNISMVLENKTVIVDFEIGTEELEVTTYWEVSALNGIISKTGQAGFSLKYLNGRIILTQPVDTRKKPQLKLLHLDIGNLQFRSEGAGTIDYVAESTVNILPNLLRYQILKMLEEPMKHKIQKELDELDVEEVIKQESPKIDEFQEKGFKLSELRAINEEIEEDDFFNF